MQYDKLSNRSLNEFRILVRKAMSLQPNEENAFYSLPESFWKQVFKQNFNSDLTYAQNVILGNPEPYYHKDSKKLERVKKGIDNFDRAVSWFHDYLHSGRKIIVLTDTDNDGSLAQAVIRQAYDVIPEEFRKNLIVHFARATEKNPVRGFSGELVEDLASRLDLDKDDDFLVVTADNGMNSIREQEKIMKAFAHAKLMITDHHEPEDGMAVVENERTLILNPKYRNPDIEKSLTAKERERRDESIEFFEKYNISGASVMGLLISEYLNRRLDLGSLSIREQMEALADSDYRQPLAAISSLSNMSNMLDYVVTHPADKPKDRREIKHALDLQRLLNLNNSSNPLFNKNISPEQLELMQERAAAGESPDIQEITNINGQMQVLNVWAGKLLKEYQHYLLSDDAQRVQINHEAGFSPLKENMIEQMLKGDVQTLPASESLGNENYVEQLRPIIFSLTEKDNKNQFETQILDSAQDIYKQLDKLERKLIRQMRKTHIMDSYQTEHTGISVLPKMFYGTFNRKLLNKAYTPAKKGISITFDLVLPHQVSGSFRSEFPISEILNRSTKRELEKVLGADISTPGHSHAAGFIIRAKTANMSVLDFSEPQTLRQMMMKTSDILNRRIGVLAEKYEKTAAKKQNAVPEIVIGHDLAGFAEDLNRIIMGNVAGFYSFQPLLSAPPALLVNNSASTGKQTNYNETLLEKSADETWGWTVINTRLAGKAHDSGALLMPSSLLRRHIELGHDNQYIRLSYLNGGAFVGSQLVSKSHLNPENTISLEQKSPFVAAIREYFGQVKASGRDIQHLSRKDLQDNVFFKSNPYAAQEFKRYENMIIGIINSNNADRYTVIDVEAIGLGNAEIINWGQLSFMIDESSGIRKDRDSFQAHVFKGEDDREYWVENPEELIKSGLLQEISNIQDVPKLSIMYHQDKVYRILGDSKEFRQSLDFIGNKREEAGEVVFNQTLRAEAQSFIVKPKQIIPAPIAELTGINNELADEFGISAAELDNKLSAYFAGSRNVFIAHNTPYDAGITAANLPKMFAIMTSYDSLVADSALWSKELALMYDNARTVAFQNIPQLKGLYFYDNPHSKVNLSDFLSSDENGEYPDISNRYHIVKTVNDVSGEPSFYLRRMSDNQMESLKVSESRVTADGKLTYISATLRDLVEQRNNVASMKNKMPVLTDSKMGSNEVGYNANGMGILKQVRQMMRQNESFQPDIISDYSAYPHLKDNLQLQNICTEIQRYYRFNQSVETNLTHFKEMYPDTLKPAGDLYYSSLRYAKETGQSRDEDLVYDDILKLMEDFVNKNRRIDAQFNNGWYRVMALKNYPQINRQSDINQTSIKIASDRTGIPADVVREVVIEAYNHKKKNGLPEVLIAESHMNGSNTGWYIGDTAYECPATMLLLSEETRNPCANDIDGAVELFNRYALKSHMSLLSQYKNPAVDSMSFNQSLMLHENMQGINPMLERASEKAQSLMGKESNLYELNLDEQVLQAGKQVFIIPRPNTGISHETVLEDADKIAYLVAVGQLAYGNKSRLPNVGEDALPLIETYRDDLMSRYAYIGISNRKEMLGNYQKALRDFIVSDEGSLSKLLKSNAINIPARSNMGNGRETLFLEDLLRTDNVLRGQLYQEMSHIFPMSKKQQRELSAYMDMPPHERLDADCSKNPAMEILKVADEIQFGRSPIEFQTDAKNILPKVENIGTLLAAMVQKGEWTQQQENMLAALLVNSYAIDDKVRNPALIERKLREIQRGVQYPVEKTAQGFYENFLDSEKPIVRQSPLAHLSRKMPDYLMPCLQATVQRVLEQNRAPDKPDLSTFSPKPA